MRLKSLLHFTTCFLLTLTILTFSTNFFENKKVLAADPPVDTCVSAGTVTWVGGTDSNWETAANWDTTCVPWNLNDVIINTATTVNLNGPSIINSLVLGVDGVSTASILNFNYDAVSLEPLVIDDGDVTLYAGSAITHSAGTSSVLGLVNIDVQTGSFYLNSSSSINVDAKGYQGGAGTGAGGGGSWHNGGGGAGHGGPGGNGNTGASGGIVYDTMSNPILMGSGGGNSGIYSGGAGGGLLFLTVSNQLVLEGNIQASGGNGSGWSDTYGAGGGSGGTVNIIANSITGNGNIYANGGNGAPNANSYGGGGGGGIITLKYTTSLSIDGTLSANGGTGTGAAIHGGPGLIFTKSDAQSYGELTLMNSNNPSPSTEGVYTIISPTNYDSFILRSGVMVNNNSNLTITGALSVNSGSQINLNLGSTTTHGSLVWTSGGIIADNGGSATLFTPGSDLTVPAGCILYSNYPRVYGTVNVNGTLSHAPNGTTEAYKIELTVNEDFIINPGGSLDVSSKGFRYDAGDGAGTTGGWHNGGGGGGHASPGGSGYSGAAGGAAYDNMANPTTLGSGGGSSSTYLGGYGGGAIILTVTGEAILNDDILANGGNGSGWSDAHGAGGGSGGTVNITANSVTGVGNIYANGGNGANNANSYGGGGAGGYITLKYNSSFSVEGLVTANGGVGYSSAKQGGPGYILKKSNSQTYGELTLMNTGNPSISTEGVVTIDSPLSIDMLNLMTGVMMNVNSDLTVTGALSVNSGSQINLNLGSTTTHGSLVWTSGGIVADNGGSATMFTPGSDLTVPAGCILYSNYPRVYGTVNVNGTLSHAPNGTTEAYKIELTVNKDFIINPGGAVDVSSKGFSGGYGDGTGTAGSFNSGAGGAGHGGVGGNGSTGKAGGGTYDVSNNPTLLGSGGANNSGYSGGSGGGAILLTVADEAILNDDIFANGGNGSGSGQAYGAGGGSGGTISIIATSISGSGNVYANGGTGASNVNACSGGGGGGLIALKYSTSYSLSGSVTANGGFGPGSATDGETVEPSIIQLNSLPTVSNTDITVSDNFYAGKLVTINTVYSDADGATDLDKLYLKITNPSTNNIEYYATQAEDATTLDPVHVSGSEYISSIKYDIDSASPDANSTTVTWYITPNWNWDESTEITVGIKATDQQAAVADYTYKATNYIYENDLDFTGTLAVSANETAVNDLDWIEGGISVTFTGVKVVYEGTIDKYPEDGDFDVKLTDANDRWWLDGSSSGEDFSITVNSLETTHSGNIYTLEVVDIPTGGSSLTTQTFTLKVDATDPTIISLESSSHPSSTTWYSNTEVDYQWEATDSESGIASIWTYITDALTATTEEILNNGQEQEGSTLTQTLTNGIWNLYLLVVDTIGNAIQSSISVKIDSDTPDIVDITGANENTYQNTSSSVTLTWSDPESLSNDSFYITVDGSTPSSSNFEYASNQPTYTLTNLPQGETTIRVIAKNGAGTYSLARNFVFKYDTTAPSQVTSLVALVSTQNLVTLTWSNPTDSDFSKVLILRKEGSASTGTTDGTKIYEGNLQTFTGSALESSKTYYYSMWTYDLLGNVSESSVVSATTNDLIPPSAVTNINATVSSQNRITLTWKNPSDSDFSKVVVLRKEGSQSGSITDGTKVYEGALQTLTDQVLNSSKTYHYSIWTYDTSGNISTVVSKAVNTKDLIPPNDTTNVVSVQEGSGIKLTWKNSNSSDFSKVKIVRTNPDTTTTDIYEGNLESYLDSTVAQQGTYTYTFTAYDTVGNNSKTVTTTVEYVKEQQESTPITVVNSSGEEQSVSSDPININAGEEVEIKIPVTSFTEDVNRVVATINGTEYEMTLSKNKKEYVAKITTKDIEGIHTVSIKGLNGDTVVDEQEFDINVEAQDTTSNRLLTISVVGGIVLLLTTAVLLNRRISSKKAYTQV